MGYIALYRKYRPNRFEDIVDQNSITSILKNQIKNSKISHAYIFSGSRGTGKTSAAKVFARAINCLDSIDGEPCNTCSACLNILNGENTDVVEMDAASNNSVENIRQIRSEVAYAATSVKYRVYIIDEVHMLTTSAFNALLKTLEEPPENVVFILATTEQHKIPVTILSRCLRFEFSKISEKGIKDRVISILNEENIKFEEDAVNYIAKLADGALRDALSILERCLSEKEDILTLSKIEEIIGATNSEIIKSLADNILSSNSSKIIETIDVVSEKGKDLRQLLYSLTEYFLDKLISVENVEETLRIANIIDNLSVLDSEIRLSFKPSILVKAALIRISNSSLNNNSNNNILTKEITNNSINVVTEDRIRNIENKLKQIENQNFEVKKQEVSAVKYSLENTEKKDANIQSNSTELKKFKNYEDLKNKIVGRGKLKLFSTLAGANMYFTDDSFVIITNNEFAYKILCLDEQKNEISNIIKEEYSIDKNLIIKFVKQTDSNKMEKTFKDNSVEYTSLD